MDASTPDLPIACSLSAAEYYRRLGEFQHLFAAALTTFRRERTRLIITLEGKQEVEASAIELFSREKECCPFFSFELRRDGDEVLVLAEVPDEADPCLDDLERLAKRVMVGMADGR
jgi:hypothetical protein